MGFFSNPEEDARKANLKRLEDKRVAFAQAMEARGFRPERMLMSLQEDGAVLAVCRFQDRGWLIVSPVLGTDDDFALEACDRFDVRVEQVNIKAEGMGGMFGFGKKGQHGVEYHIARQDGGEAVMAFVFGRSAWAEFTYAKNPLLKVKRRRGDANVAWELKPIESGQLARVIALAEAYLGIRG